MSRKQPEILLFFTKLLLLRKDKPEISSCSPRGIISLRTFVSKFSKENGCACVFSTETFSSRINFIWFTEQEFDYLQVLFCEYK